MPGPGAGDNGFRSPTLWVDTPFASRGVVDGPSLAAYLRVLSRRRWVIVVSAVLVCAFFFLVSSLQTKSYQASTQLIYESAVDVSNPLGDAYVDPNLRSVELQSVPTLLSSPELTVRAEDLMVQEGGAGVLAPGYEVSAQTVPGADQAAGVTTFSSVAAIDGESSDPELAALAANSYAAALIDIRKERQQKRVSQAIAVVESTLKGMKSESERASSDYIMLQQRLHDLEIQRSTATGGFRIVVPAETPSSAASPRPYRSAVLGLFLGIILGIILAFILEQLDSRVRSDSDIAGLLSLPILARIPRISKRLLDQSALVTLTDSDGTSAESFRVLRTNLGFLSVDGDARSVLLTSCVQGEGKSVTIANLAVTLALGGKRVVVVDADLRRPRMHSYFGLPNDRGVSTVVSGQSDLAGSLQAVPVSPASPPAGGDGFDRWAAGGVDGDVTKLYVLTSGPSAPNPGEIVSSKRFGQLLEMLTPKADIVLVDSPAMLAVGDTPSLGDKVDGLLFLVEPDVVRKQQLVQAREQLDKLPCKALGIIVARRKAGSSYYGPRYYYRENEDGRRVRAGRSNGSGAREKTPEPLA
jgi:Mrp family chromosome partitioning ATPase/capsular polysaccharide biosynthesis protein